MSKTSEITVQLAQAQLISILCIMRRQRYRRRLRAYRHQNRRRIRSDPRVWGNNSFREGGL